VERKRALEILQDFAEKTRGLPVALGVRIKAEEVLLLEASAGEGDGERAFQAGEDGEGLVAFLRHGERTGDLVLDHPALLLRWRGEDLFCFPRGLLEGEALEELKAGAKTLSLLLGAFKRPLALQAARDLTELSALLEDPRPFAWGRRFLAAKREGGASVAAGDGARFPASALEEREGAVLMRLFRRRDSWVRCRAVWRPQNVPTFLPLLVPVEGRLAGAPLPSKGDPASLGALFADPPARGRDRSLWEEWLGVPKEVFLALEAGQGREALRLLALAALERT